MRQRWEYLTLFVQADAKREEAFVEQFRDWKSAIPPHTPEAMIPQLNALGEQGWELVHMQPTFIGDKRDVLMQDSGSGNRRWTSHYFCVFKRAAE
jgi:hypothetical protein